MSIPTSRLPVNNTSSAQISSPRIHEAQQWLANLMQLLVFGTTISVSAFLIFLPAVNVVIQYRTINSKNKTILILLDVTAIYVLIQGNNCLGNLEFFPALASEALTTILSNPDGHVELTELV
ncbi:hypothetical protein HG537_0B06260 [Torulaspora globosa]|uniref:Uncharacterized protein n=1 Tax=Torulaspora globosa TaxID=48254 RepID=A0A7H9HND6_9SACH|nr:hypothetical protein HG537_0B06260 [Torulaspora sp. CBS 2947]